MNYRRGARSAAGGMTAFIWTSPVCQGNLCVLTNRKAAALYPALLQVEPAGLDGIRWFTPHLSHGLLARKAVQVW